MARLLAALLPCALLSVASAMSIGKLAVPMRPSTSKPYPLVIWHGLGDNFENEGLRAVGDLAQEIHPGTTVYLVRLGADGNADKSATFFGNLTEQLAEVCEAIATHEELGSAPAINAIGFSQGGQFMRGYVERCNAPRVANLVTFGSQHNGIAEFQDCGDGDWWCNAWQGVLKSQTWTNYVQSHLVPAQYFRNPDDLEPYLENSNYLADINNEREVKNSTYAKNMKKLDKFVMYLFKDDTVVVPRESGWFSEVNRTSGEETKLRDRRMYEEDWLGLRWLDERGRLEFKETKGRHMELSDELLRDVMKKYFGPRKDNMKADVKTHVEDDEYTSFEL